MPPKFSLINIMGGGKRVDANTFLRDVLKWGLSLGLASTAVGLTSAGIAKGLEAAGGAISRKRNQEKILAAKPELAKIPGERFSMLYNTVRRISPELASDPLFASEAIKRIHEMPESVIAVVPEMARARQALIEGKIKPGTLAGAVRSAAGKVVPITGLEPINYP